MSAADDFETADAPLCPNKADIAAHLYALFSPAFVHPTIPMRGSKSRMATPTPKAAQSTRHKTFPRSNSKQAAEFAEQKNKAGFNIYIGPALRRASESRQGERRKHS